MTIQQNIRLGNSHDKSLEKYLGAGNFIPHLWYHKILRAGGKPDTVAITILSELVYHYRISETGEREFQLGHAHFRQKFNLTQNQTYEALVRLEQKGLISRDERPVIMYGRKFGNELFITLKVENLIKLLESGKSGDKGKKFTQGQNCSFSPYKENSPFNIDKNNIEIKSRSGGSNFCKEKNLNTNQQSKPITNNPEIKKLAGVNPSKRKQLSEFHPLNAEDAEILRTSSGREFSLHYMNQLLLKLSALKPEYGFYRKETFMKYMTKVLANEFRDATKVSNEGFRFKQEAELAAKEKYLEEVEYSKDTAHLTQLKRKIVAVFDDETAYDLLRRCEFKGLIEEDNHFEIKLMKNFNMSDYVRQKILEQVRVVYGNHIKDLKVINCSDSKKTVVKEATKSFNLNLGTPGSTWHKVSSKLAEYFGAPLHYSWFSKLEAEEDLEKRSIKLKAPTKFIRDWVESNYKYVIEQCCESEQYAMSFCT